MTGLYGSEAGRPSRVYLRRKDGRLVECGCCRRPSCDPRSSKDRGFTGQLLLPHCHYHRDRPAGIGRVRRIPDLPAEDYSSQGIVQWKTWLAKHKGQAFSKPVSESVSDPYLQCLARKVEWGYPDAVLEIARVGSKS